MKITAGQVLSSDKHECAFCSHQTFAYVGPIGSVSGRHYLECFGCGKQIRLSAEEIHDYFGIELEEIDLRPKPVFNFKPRPLPVFLAEDERAERIRLFHEKHCSKRYKK